MKGIIAEIDGRKMIVITKNGEFIKCKKLPHHNVGDEINVQKTNMTSVYKKMSAIAASFLIFAMLSTGVYAYYTPYSYVSVDINPSFEFTVNRFEKVIGVHAFNEDAEKIISASDSVKYKDIEDALEQILDTVSEQGFLKQDEVNSIMYVVSSGNKKEEAAVSNKISVASTEILEELSGDYEVILETTKIDSYKQAKKQNISPGKVILANQLKEVKPDINEEDIKNMSLQQAIKQIEKKEEKGITPDKSKVEVSYKKNNNTKVQKDNKVKNIEELIIEKNEDLGKKIIDKKKDEKQANKEKENLNDDNQANNKNDKDKNNKNNDNNTKSAEDKNKEKDNKKDNN